MNPITKAPAAPAPMPAPNLVDNIPVRAQGQAAGHRDDDAELDEIMQDVGRELHKADEEPKRQRFWEFSGHHKKEANFSTQMSIKKGQPAAAAKPPAPAPAAPVVNHQVQGAHNRVKPIAQKPAKPPKPPRQHRAPLMVVIMTVLVTAALIAVAYRTYQ